ncbi:unnamed protein product [Symbiodinium natans]|uniref:Uncharacterized protein n=1 Tax=Symbiodinium natans TaxID=878477 RepID=A0A812HBY2_9DINO|nr:unnamed protein product [Symbiodinium natans]
MRARIRIGCGSLPGQELRKGKPHSTPPDKPPPQSEEFTTEKGCLKVSASSLPLHHVTSVCQATSSNHGQHTPKISCTDFWSVHVPMWLLLRSAEACADQCEHCARRGPGLCDQDVGGLQGLHGIGFTESFKDDSGLHI